MIDTLSPIPNAIEFRNALPRPNWEAIAGWVESNVEPSLLHDTWTQLARDWLVRLSQALPPVYTLYESPEFLLLGADAMLAKRILDWCERVRKLILENLPDIARDEGFGKHVVLAFANTESYYDYIDDFYPEEGEFALTSGLFLNVGYGHQALCPPYCGEYERMIAHELTHVLLRHLPLPLWRNEGVTQYMEDVAVEASYFSVDHEIVRQHRRYWNAETIHEFWSGNAFYFPDEGQELSYHLSQMLFRNLISDYPQKIGEILNAANYLDAGNAAFATACNTTLAERVSQILGNGAWAPRDESTNHDE